MGGPGVGVAAAPASTWFQLDSLYRFNAKFAPVWIPRYLCYRGTLSLPRVAYAAMEAEAFIRRPPLLRRLVGTTVLSGDEAVRVPARPAEAPAGTVSG
jgi:lysyl-tRNA synthetase class 2